METESLLLKKLIGYLNELPDVRRTAGRRHQQDFALMIVLFATMSGYIGYRAIGDFIEKHREDLIVLFKPKKDRVPSYSTVRRILMKLNPKAFLEAYQKWLVDVRSARALEEESEGEKKEEAQRWHAIDGKAARGANRLSDTDYTHLVSIFATFDKMVVDSENVDAKTNEIPCVQSMIEESDLKGVIFTIDALHCQKKTVKTIIESENDYVIAVKQNQPSLYDQIQETINENVPIDIDYTLEKNRGRTEERAIFVYDANLINKTEWIGVKQVIQVFRNVQHKDGHQSVQEAFYIESTGKTAADLNQGIRGHWSIENTLHWTKDVVFKEDASTIHMEQAPENMSLIKNWVMSIFRINNYKSITKGIRLVANNLKMMVGLLE